MSRGVDEGEATMSMQRWRPHLYLILDDWEFGYSYYKLDLTSRASDLILPDGSARLAATCLPPHFFRLQARRGLPFYFTATGSKILGMHPMEEGYSHDNGGSCFDVHAGAFSFVPRHANETLPVYFPMGNNKLFTFGSPSSHLLDIAVVPTEVATPAGCPWRWSRLPDAPVNSVNAISHAASPDGRTIFVSVGFVAVECTYSFHFSEDDGSSPGVWRHQGDWILPFHGRGYFDSKLNTWIGLSLYREETGHICSCDLASAGTSSLQRRPEVKYTKDSLFTDDPDERHVGATLVCMGGHKSKFCLVECVSVSVIYSYEGSWEFGASKRRTLNDDQYMLRLTMFSLEYDRDNGDLTAGHRRVRYYKMPQHVSQHVCRYPVAFWM